MSRFTSSKQRLAISLSAAGILLSATSFQAARADAPSDLQSFKACAAVKADTARLACYDKAAAAFDFAGTKERLSEAKKLKEEAAQLRAEADRQRAEAEARKAETARLKAEAAARQAELARAQAEEKAQAEAEAKRKAEMKARKTTDFGLEQREDTKTVDRVDSTITRVDKPRLGSVQPIVIYLENGQVWRQSDGKRPGVLRPGMKIHIKKSPFSGYLMAIEDTNHSFHVLRVQ